MFSVARPARTDAQRCKTVAVSTSSPACSNTFVGRSFMFVPFQ